jgi:hypothetical protein
MMRNTGTSAGCELRAVFTLHHSIGNSAAVTG